MTGKFYQSRHPLVLDKIARLRDKRTTTPEFRRIVGEVALLLGYEVLANIDMKTETVKTPLASCQCQMLARPITFVTILRAGLGMTDGLMKLEPTANLAHIGIYRNESTLEPVRYYARFPKNIGEHYVVLADPMLATGGSAVESLSILKAQGAKHISFVCMLAARGGIKKVMQAHPDVSIVAGMIDEELNDKGYIVPGLGDAGDRMFGTI